MAYTEDTRSGYRSITIKNYKPDVKIESYFAYIEGPNGLTYVCVNDDILQRSEGELGRVSISQSVQLLTSQLAGMDKDELTRFIQGVSEDRGIHGGRLELSIKYGHPTSHELAMDVFAHHFDVGEEALIGLSGGNIFRNIPRGQAEGLLGRLERSDRLEVVKYGLYAGLKPNSTHLLSNRKILVVK